MSPETNQNENSSAPVMCKTIQILILKLPVQQCHQRHLQLVSAVRQYGVAAAS